MSGRVITFTLPYATPTRNVLDRTHPQLRRRMKRRMGMDVVVQMGGRLQAPFQRAHVDIERHSTGTPDYDGAVGGVKDLLDCLTTPVLQANGRVKNKFGIGLIVDDGPQCITLDVRCVKCRLCEQRTVVTVREIAE